jgi:predicted ATP-dependent serine protease
MVNPQTPPSNCPLKEPSERLPLGQTDRLSWFDDFLGGMLGGGIYLLGGSPGGRKSGLATQLALELGVQGIGSTTILTEESESRFIQRAAKITSEWSEQQAKEALSLARCDSHISDLEQLPNLLLREFLNPHGRYAGSKLIVVDSVQGHATPSTAMRKYARLFEFDQLARSAGIAVLLICQLTKSNRLSGPRALEHHADVVLQLSKVGDFRVLSLTKNRFGPEQPGGLALVIDSVTTALRPSPFIEPVTGVARTFMGSAIGESELQAAVSLPTAGARPTITAPGLPRRRIELILDAISGLPMLDFGSFSMSVSALLPGDCNFRGWLSLPLAVALIGSCLRRSVPNDTLFLGEIDLNRAIRPLPNALIDALSTTLLDPNFDQRLRLIVPQSAVDVLSVNPLVKVIGCATLDQVVFTVWPETR